MPRCRICEATEAPGWAAPDLCDLCARIKKEMSRFYRRLEAIAEASKGDVNRLLKQMRGAHREIQGETSAGASAKFKSYRCRTGDAQKRRKGIGPR